MEAGTSRRYGCVVEPETQWYLVEALANARADAGARDDYEAKQRTLSHFAGVLAGFRYLIAVTQEEEQTWYRKMLAALGYELPDPPPPGISQAIYVGDPKKRPAARPESEQAPAFVRSHPGPDQEFELYGGKLRVIAIEVYDSSVVVRWRVAPEPDISLAFPTEAEALERDMEGLEDWAVEELRRKADQRMRRRRLYRFGLRDDVGTSYFQRGHRSGGGGGLMTGEAEFQPAPPPNVTSLVFSWFSLEVPIPLP